MAVFRLAPITHIRPTHEYLKSADWPSRFPASRESLAIYFRSLPDGFQPIIEIAGKACSSAFDIAPKRYWRLGPLKGVTR
jgi:hypothetical protein